MKSILFYANGHKTVACFSGEHIFWDFEALISEITFSTTKKKEEKKM